MYSVHCRNVEDVFAMSRFKRDETAGRFLEIPIKLPVPPTTVLTCDKCGTRCIDKEVLYAHRLNGECLSAQVHQWSLFEDDQ